MEICNIVLEVVTKSNPKKNKHEKEKWLPEEVIKTDEKIREVKGKGESARYTHWNAVLQREARRHKKVLVSEQCKN